MYVANVREAFPLGNLRVRVCLAGGTAQGEKGVRVTAEGRRKEGRGRRRHMEGARRAVV